ncbi:MAG: hypothetical protein AAF693_11345 [Bacteroidota bacterium]
MTDYIIDEYWNEVIQERHDGYDDIVEEFEDDLEDFEEEEEEEEEPYYFIKEFTLGATFITVSKLVQFGLISLALYIAFTLTKETEHIEIRDVFKIIIISQFIFFIPLVVKFIWFLGIN